MTEKQKELLDFIAKFINQNGFSPSYDEMLQGIRSKGKGQIGSMLKSLEEAGEIKISGRSRGVTLTNKSSHIGAVAQAINQLDSGQITEAAFMARARLICISAGLIE